MKFLSVNQKGGGTVTVGDMGIVNVGIQSVVQEGDAYNFTGIVLGDSQVKLHAAVERFSTDKTLKAGQKDKAVLRNAKRQAFNATVELCRLDLGYKLAVRKMQLGRLLRKEICSALCGKGSRRSFCLGPCCLDTDFKIFCLDGFDKKEFSYPAGTLADLDSLLGERWDVQQLQNRIQFVTSILVRINENWVISGTITSSISWKLTPQNNYRSDLC